MTVKTFDNLEEAVKLEAKQLFETDDRRAIEEEDERPLFDDSYFMEARLLMEERGEGYTPEYEDHVLVKFVQSKLVSISLSDCECAELVWLCNNSFFPKVILDNLSLKKGQPRAFQFHQQRAWEVPEKYLIPLQEFLDDDPTYYLRHFDSNESLYKKIIKIAAHQIVPEL